MKTNGILLGFKWDVSPTRHDIWVCLKIRPLPPKSPQTDGENDDESLNLGKPGFRQIHLMMNRKEWSGVERIELNGMK
jgi:hypothetical protein